MNSDRIAEEYPFVTVIIPVYNAEAEIDGLLKALNGQSYPAHRVEILIIDNGSKDRTCEKLRIYSETCKYALRMLEEKDVRSSYAARNHGLLAAKGEIIAFTDADCRPVPEWIAEGVRCLRETEADLVGGSVKFTFRSSRPNAAEWIDSTTNMQMEADIRDRGVTKTANLFVAGRVFEQVGSFRSDIQSGGDVAWTAGATAAGFKLLYAPSAIVYHPSRGWLELFAKQVRVGRGQAALSRGLRGAPGGRAAVSSSTGRGWQRIFAGGQDLGRPSSIKLVAAVLWVGSALVLGRITGSFRTFRKGGTVWA